jgi:hypothetical protein
MITLLLLSTKGTRLDRPVGLRYEMYVDCREGQLKCNSGSSKK